MAAMLNRSLAQISVQVMRCRDHRIGYECTAFMRGTDRLKRSKQVRNILVDGIDIGDDIAEIIKYDVTAEHYLYKTTDYVLKEGVRCQIDRSRGLKILTCKLEE